MIADEAIRDLDEPELKALCDMALGRIFLLGSRPEQPGDVTVYYQARSMFLAAYERERLGGRIPEPEPLVQHQLMVNRNRFGESG